MSEFKNEKSYVQILPSGEMLYCGRKLSTVELDVGKALCDMGKGSRVRGTSEMDSTDVGDDFIDDTMSEISQESTESMPIPSRPKAVHKRRRKVTSSSELPADDIRLTYPKQYFAALNSGDASTIAEMLNNIAIPNVVLVSKKLTYSTEHHLPNYLEIIGVDAIASVCETFFLATPDVVVQLLSHKIHCFANGESMIECDVAMKGSKMYELTGLPEGTSDKVVLNSVEEVATSLNKVHLKAAPSTAQASSGGSVSRKKKLIASITSSGGGGGSDPPSKAGGEPSDNDSQSSVSSSVVSREVPVELGKALAKAKPIKVDVKVTFHLNPLKKVFLIISEKD